MTWNMRDARWIVAAGLLALGGCSSGPPPAPAISPVDARREALAAEHGTRLERPSRLLFAWSAQEPEFRGSGMGVARLEPPYRARLDLFLANGETVAQAALVGDDLRLPDWVPDGLIPPAPLLWATLGVFRPGNEAEFLEGRGEAGRLEVDYLSALGPMVRFHLQDRQVTEAALVEGGDVIQRLMIDGGDGAFPAKATYRHIPDFRELRLELESVEYVESFPPDIWEPSQ